MRLWCLLENLDWSRIARKENGYRKDGWEGKERLSENFFWIRTFLRDPIG
jgi:hypothetical protein